MCDAVRARELEPAFQFALWGNKADLSMLAGLAGNEAAFQSIQAHSHAQHTV